LNSVEGAEDYFEGYFSTCIDQQPLFKSNPRAKTSTPVYKQQVACKWEVLRHNGKNSTDKTLVFPISKKVNDIMAAFMGGFS